MSTKSKHGTHPVRYAPEVKARAVARLNNGERASDIAKAVGCTDSVVYLWRSQARSAAAGNGSAAPAKASQAGGATRDAIALLKHAATEMTAETGGRIDKLTRSNKLCLLALDTLTGRTR